MANSEWQKQTTTLEYLKKQAKSEHQPISIVAWLRLIGVVPLTVEWRRGNRLPNTNLNPDAISAGYLAEVAHDWDKEGRSTPSEFVDALCFEVQGTAEKRAVGEVLAELSLEGMQWHDSPSVS